MICDQARANFSALYDETLSGARLVTITQHLASCPACRAEWASFRKAMQAVADLGPAGPSSGFAARVRQRLEAPTRWQGLLRWLFFPLYVKLPIQAVAVVLVAFAGLLLYQRSPELHRATAPSRDSSPLPGRVAPTPAPPPTAGEATRKSEVPAPRAEAPRASPAPPPVAVVPKSAAPSGVEKDRRPSTNEEAKGARQTPTPPESPKGEEPAGDFRAKGGKPGPPPQTLRQAAPPPAESSPKSLAAPPSAPRSSAAPAKENYTSSLQGMPADALYVAGLTDLADRKYERSMDEFRTFLIQYPQDARAPDARLRLGDAYFGLSMYAEALREYEAVVQQFPSSPQVPTALYLQAQARLAQGDLSGCQLLRNLAEQYPQTPDAASARQILSTRCR